MRHHPEHSLKHHSNDSENTDLGLIAVGLKSKADADTGEAILIDTVALMLKDRSKHTLLTHDDEIRLGALMEAGKVAGKALESELTLTSKQISEYLSQVEAGQQARDELLRCNGKLVISVAKKYQNHGLEFADLVQEGEVGLISACKHFDYKKGWRFSTYATWWIKQAITRSLSTKSRTIRVPVHLSEDLRTFREKVGQLEQKLGISPSETDITQHFSYEYPPKKLKKLVSLMSLQPSSLNEPLSEDSGTSELQDFVSDSHNFTEESDNDMIYSELMSSLHQVLQPRAVDILIKRFFYDQTLEEIAESMGLTRERIRQIEKKSLLQLQKSPKTKQLKLFFDSHSG